MSKFLLKSGSVAVGLVILLSGGGCATPPTFRGFFEEHRAEFPVTDQGLLLETLRVLVLLEDYCLALGEMDMERLLACYSPRYSHYEHGLDWRKERIEEIYFSPFERLEAAFGPVAIEFVRKDSGDWLRQEDFDWLRSPRVGRRPVHAYRIVLPSGSGPVELFLGAPPASPEGVSREHRLALPDGSETAAESGEGVIPVVVGSQVDPAVERPLGEASFRISIRGRLAEGKEGGDFVSTLRERVVFLLEKEDGEWKIVSQF